MSEDKFKEGTILYSPKSHQTLCVLEYSSEEDDYTCINSADDDVFVTSEGIELNDFRVVGNAISEENFLAIINMDDSYYDALLTGLIFKCTVEPTESFKEGYWNLLYDNIWTASKETLEYANKHLTKLKELMPAPYEDFDNLLERVDFMLSEHNGGSNE